MAKSKYIRHTSSKPVKDKREVKGHMALRNNVYDLKLELWHVLKPLEMHLVDIIIDKTIKWRTKVAPITIQEFMERTRQADTHIYNALRSLTKKTVVIRQKEKSHSLYGLNEEYFGGLLIKRHEDALVLRRNKLKIIVDNSKPTDGNRQSNRPVPSVELTDTVSTSDLYRQSKHIQDTDIIDEKGCLNTFLKDISINTSLKESPQGDGKGIRRREELNSFPREKGPEDWERERQRQLREAKKAGII